MQDSLGSSQASQNVDAKYVFPAYLILAAVFALKREILDG